MKHTLYKFFRKLYWSLPFSPEAKENGVVFLKKTIRNSLQRINANSIKNSSTNIFELYSKQILSIPSTNDKEFVAITSSPYQYKKNDTKLIAYYLPQFHPTAENDEWWGKGVTEWNNVTRAVPQYINHYQPRFPGELGYYDLRIEENIARQAELAKMYGVYGFAYYYYWFDGKRLLDKPLDSFLNSAIDFNFCLCWANESWTRRFDGSSGEILLKQSPSRESYIDFIKSIEPYIKDKRYIKIEDKPVIIIYKPSLIPDCANVLVDWRNYLKTIGIGEVYIMGVKEYLHDLDLINLGFDAQSEFQPGNIFKYAKDISNSIRFLRDDFGGRVFDYKHLVENKIYFKSDHKKIYRSVMPMWDNTARRDNKGVIFDGATPQLYKTWLIDSINKSKHINDLPESFVFINAWNEWGEGAYLEPDKKYGYAYLEATKQALEETR